MSETWLVVGLGNPGQRYAANRHNLGRMVVDLLAQRHSSSWKRHKAGAQVADARVGPPGAGHRIVLAAPDSYMNESGRPVAGLLRFFSIPVERLVVIHDELDLPFDQVRLKRGGGEGGHNGLRHISTVLGTRDYLRVRAGIGRPPGRMDAAAYVLRDFSATERETLPILVEDAADATEQLVLRGLTDAQQTVHAPR